MKKTEKIPEEKKVHQHKKITTISIIKKQKQKADVSKKQPYQ